MLSNMATVGSRRRGGAEELDQLLGRRCCLGAPGELMFWTRYARKAYNDVDGRPFASETGRERNAPGGSSHTH